MDWRKLLRTVVESLLELGLGARGLMFGGKTNTN